MNKPFKRDTFVSPPETIAPQKILVLAGNQREYEQWLFENKKSKEDYEYIANDINILGRINPKYVRTGTWYMRKEIDAIEIDLHSVGAQQVG